MLRNSSLYADWRIVMSAILLFPGLNKLDGGVGNFGGGRGLNSTTAAFVVLS